MCWILKHFAACLPQRSSLERPLTAPPENQRARAGAGAPAGHPHQPVAGVHGGRVQGRHGHGGPQHTGCVRARAVVFMLRRRLWSFDGSLHPAPRARTNPRTLHPAYLHPWTGHFMLTPRAEDVELLIDAFYGAQLGAFCQPEPHSSAFLMCLSEPPKLSNALSSLPTAGTARRRFC